MLKMIRELNLQVEYVRRDQLDRLSKSDALFDVILLTPPFEPADKVQPFKFRPSWHMDKLTDDLQWIDECHLHLSKRGSLLIYSIPRWLPYYAEHLHSKMAFKYWIAIKSLAPPLDSPMFRTCHEGVVLFVSDPSKFTINTVRYPHIFCSQCGDYLADWGGKKHLRPKDGPVISDVWDDREDLIDKDHHLASHTLDRLLQLTCRVGSRVLFAMWDQKIHRNMRVFQGLGVKSTEDSSPARQTLHIMHRSGSSQTIPAPQATSDFRTNEVFVGDCVEVLSSWLNNEKARFDLIFADPPYNLEKGYSTASDDLKEQEYVRWCDTWLDLCVDLLKPHGTLYVLNLPKWSYFHATRLDRKLYRQHWIAWDALSDPRGRVMPAHYALLVYTKHPANFIYNRPDPIPTMDQCLRAKCLTSRPTTAPRESLSDIWYDVHRIKHKRDRDAHPCQLPIKLVERIIQVSSNPGDLVLDPFMGTGTTALTAARLGRQFVGVDIDPRYREIAMSKVAAASPNGQLSNRQQRPQVTGKIKKNTINYQMPLFQLPTMRDSADENKAIRLDSD